MDVRLTVHRSAHEIGGNCIEIAEDGGHRVILDVGRPLDAPADAKSLLPRSLDLAAPCDGVLISHPTRTTMAFWRTCRPDGRSIAAPPPNGSSD
jgi:Cft2 family RNA processing exonuclease